MDKDQTKLPHAYTTLSVVSHGQGALISSLLSDLDKIDNKHFEVVVTINIPEDETPYQNRLFKLSIIRNVKTKGFGANHNAALKLSQWRRCGVVNPDVRIKSLDFDILLDPFENDKVAAIAPIVLSPEGRIEDSARKFPSFQSYVKRVIFGRRNSDFVVQPTCYPVDWAAGMFVVFRQDVFRKIGGFDDRRFFMYLEDADICRRIWARGYQVMINPEISVVHNAQRASRKSLRHLRWHVISAFRYLTGI
jgi:N-acetylglucosaminyl-diphospho-decaprenol L-rhamnosyltransferase